MDIPHEHTRPIPRTDGVYNKEETCDPVLEEEANWERKVRKNHDRTI